MTNAVGIIPCRYASTRFPGKPLADIGGKPMFWHVWNRARQCRLLDQVFIATDDRRIEDAAAALGVPVVMTRADHPTGTDRVAEVADRVAARVYVNIQGDEPMIAPEAIDAVVARLLDATDPRAMASNAFRVMAADEDPAYVNAVKVILDRDGAAMAFSRLALPFAKDGGGVTYRQQMGLYAFTKPGLDLFAATPQGEVELAEGVEMLRFLEAGYKVLMVEIADRAVAVDTPADLENARRVMAEAGLI